MSTPDIETIKRRAGGSAALAQYLGVTRAAVWQWQRVPVSRVPAVSTITGFGYHELRPDIFPAPGQRHRLVLARKQDPSPPLSPLPCESAQAAATAFQKGGA